jgi:hypothetical protein
MISLFQNKKLLSKSLLALLVCTSVLSVNAQQKFFRGTASDSFKESTLNKAKVSVWKNYIGSLQGAKLDNIMQNEKVFLADLDSFLTDVTIIDEKCSMGCTISIKATVNENVVDSKLRSISKSNPSANNSNNDDIAFLILARVADTQTSFDTKITTRTEATVGTSGAAVSAEANASNQNSQAEAAADAVSVTQTARTVTGGSQENKRDKIKYVAWPNLDDLQNRVGESLNNNKISTIPWEEIVNNCRVSDNEPFSQMYAISETGQLPSNIRTDTFNKLKNCQLTKFIMVSFEVDSYRTDPNTGLWLATGNININVYDLSGRFAKSVASVNRIFSGRAEKVNDAGRVALANASNLATEVIVNQIHAK